MTYPSRASFPSLRSTAPRRRQLDDARREQLLDQLQDLVLSEGFARFTMDDLAARLQCSKSTLYAIASSRERLVATALKRFFHDGTQRIEKRVSQISDPAERIATYLATVGAEMLQMSRACWADMIADDATAELYAINAQASARRVHEFIQDGVDAGKFRRLHARFLGEVVSLVVDGIHHGELLKRTDLSSGEAYRELSSLVLAALTNKSTDSP